MIDNAILMEDIQRYLINMNLFTHDTTNHEDFISKFYSHKYEFLFVNFCIAQKMKFSIKDFFSECDQILSLLRVWSHLLKKSLIENFIFCAALDVLRSPGYVSNALEVFLGYLPYNWQEVKTNTTFSSLAQLLQGAPQGLVLDSLLFSIYMNDLTF